MAPVWKVLLVSVIGFVLCRVGSCQRNADPGEGDDSLVVSLLRGYNKQVAPSEPMTLNYGISPVKLVDIDAERGIVTVDLWLKNNWNDSRLTWDVDEHGSSPVFFRQKHVYVPEVELYNGRSTTIIPDPEVVTYPYGVMIHFPYVRAEIYCNLTEPPFKDKICPIRIGPWSHDRRQTIIGACDPVVDHEFIHNTGPCTIGTSVAVIESSSYDCCPGLSFDTMVLHLNFSCSTGHTVASSSDTLKMKPAGQDDSDNKRLLPLIITPFFILLVFLLPLKATERIFLGTIVFVALLLIRTSGYIPTDIDEFLQLSAGLILAATLASLVPVKLNAAHLTSLAIRLDDEPKTFGCKSRLGSMIDLMLFSAVAVVLGIAAAGTLP